jgi:hypothetical protein
MAVVLRLPEFDAADTPQERADKLNQMARDLEKAVEDATQSAGGNVGGYRIQNFGTSLRTLDFAAATAQQVREFLATLARDLINAGKLRRP